MSLRDFGPNELMFLLMATRWTILLALIAFAGGGAIGLLIAGGVAARFTRGSVVFGSARQLAFGVIAIAATYFVGRLVGTVI